MVNILELHMIIVINDNCNKKYVIPKHIPIAFYNLRGYDSHIFVQNLGKYKEKMI